MAVVFLEDVAQVALKMEDADFWVQRRGTPENVGKPSRDTYNPESIGIYVMRVDRLEPTYLYYAFENMWRQGYWRQFAHGSLALQNIRVRDVREVRLDI